MSTDAINHEPAVQRDADEAPARWLRVTAEVVEDGNIVQLDDGSFATAARTLRIAHAFNDAAGLLPAMVRQAFGNFPETANWGGAK